MLAEVLLAPLLKFIVVWTNCPANAAADVVITVAAMTAPITRFLSAFFIFISSLMCSIYLIIVISF